MPNIRDLIPASVREDLDAGRDAPAALCCLCGKPIHSLRNAYRKVTGFERHRAQGGTNAVRLRRQLDEYAHDYCIDMAARGVDAGQGRLM